MSVCHLVYSSVNCPLKEYVWIVVYTWLNKIKLAQSTFKIVLNSRIVLKMLGLDAILVVLDSTAILDSARMNKFFSMYAMI